MFMKTSTIQLSTKEESVGLLSGLNSWLSGKSPKATSGRFRKNLQSGFLITSSVLLFFLCWHLGSRTLFDIEAGVMIQAAQKEGGDQAADAMRACINSGDLSCKPNALPSPSDVWHAGASMYKDHQTLRLAKSKFYKENAEINAQLKASGKKTLVYTGRSSFVDRIAKSLLTVFAGVLLALFIAVPIGILVGLNDTIRLMSNWIIQVFKPVSPVVWFLLVYMVVKTVSKNIEMDKSFMICMIAVALCSMWATLVNTSVGVSSVDKDYLNVASVLQLGFFKKIFKIILPASLPMIFTGLRVTVSVAWMVLIAIELLAQSPGLGSFVWEEFQNGASDSNAKILFAMFVIGIIGFLLDKLMLSLQKALVFSK